MYNYLKVYFIALSLIIVSLQAFAQTSGELTFRAFIDGVDEVHIHGDRIWYEHLMWSKPSQSFVNDGKWITKWNSDDTSAQRIIDPPLPSVNGFFYKITKKSGRGDIYLSVTPHLANGYKTVIVLDDGSMGGADWYEFTLSWKQTPFDDAPPEPSNKINFDVLIPSSVDGVLQIKKETATITSVNSSSDAIIMLASFTIPLPDQPVNLAQVGNSPGLDVIIKEQPRAYNDYTAMIILQKDSTILVRGYRFTLGWRDEVIVEPTPTPWPTPPATLPTPTPPNGLPKTLWVVNEDSFPKLKSFTYLSESYYYFARAFDQLGAINEYGISSETEFSDELLQQYQCVLFDDKYPNNLTPDQTQMIERYVAGGGSLFVCTDQSNDFTPSNSSQVANSITHPFGINFGGKYLMNTSGEINTLADHPINQDVISFRVGTSSELSLREPAQSLAGNKFGHSLFAASEWGYGRVVALGDSSVTLDPEALLDKIDNPDELINVIQPMHSRVGVEFSGNMQLTKNIARWMLKLEDVKPTPTPAPANSIIISISTTDRLIKRRGIFTIEIQGATVTLPTIPEYIGRQLEINTIFNQPLPSHPVQANAISLNNEFTEFQINTSPSEPSTTTIRVKTHTNNSGRFEILVTWSDLPPTPTPWPTWNPAEPTPTPIENSPNVLWIVRQHAFEQISEYFNDNFIEFRNMFSTAGANNDVLYAGEQPITDSIFVGYDAVIFGNTYSVDPLTTEEQQSVVRYVRSGGSIFVMGNQYRSEWIEESTFYASSITEPFGIQYLTTVSGDANNFSEHSITKSVSEIDISGGAKLELTSPAQSIARTSNEDTVLAVAEDGYGRVIAFGDEAAFFTPGQTFTGLRSQSHENLAQNIIHWLLRTEGDTPVQSWTLH